MTRIALITGATSGIGREFVNLLKDDPSYDELWIVGRNERALEEASDGRIIPIKADLADPSSTDRIIAKIRSANVTVGLLANCAGLGYRSAVADQSSDMISSMLDVNAKALTLLTNGCLPYMEDGSSKIINIASSAGFLPQPGFAVYAASKSYVISFGRALAEELKPRRITVTTVCPGPVETGFQEVATQGREREFTGLWKTLSVKPADVARASLKASSRGRSVLVYGFSQKLLHFAAKFIPHKWILSVIKW